MSRGPYLISPDEFSQRPASTGSRRSFAPITWWLHLTSTGWQHPPANLAESERTRRSRLASFLFLGLLITGAIFLSAGAGDIPTLLAILGGMLGIVIACILNRLGWVGVAGLIATAVLIVAIFGAILSAPGGQLAPDYLPSYDILVLAVVVAGSLLTPAAAFYIALFNSAAIAVDFLVVQSHTADLTAEINQDGIGLLLGRPIGLEIAVAVVAYLWVSGTINASRRADQAEEMAALEHAYAQQRQQLEFGVQQILATHVRIANGDYNARAPLSQDHALWQIASSLNNLVSRFRTIAEQTNRVGYQLQRTEEEVHRLAMALRDLQGGRRPIWPAPSRTAVDELLPILAGRDRREPTLPPPQSWEGGTGGGQFGQGGSQPQRFGESAYGWPTPANAAAPTPPPMSGGGWAHNPPRFGPPQTDGFRQPNSTPRPDSTGSAGQMPPMPMSPSSPFSPQQAPGSSPRSFEQGWPSLDGSATGSTDWGTGEVNGGMSGAAPGEDAFLPLDNPWYLPPDE